MNGTISLDDAPDGSRSAPAGGRDLHGQRILLMNFYARVLHRGIPLYADNLSVAFENEGVQCTQMTCPRALIGLPRPVLDLLFVICEQLVVPIMGLWFSHTIYPYNTVSILHTIFGRPSMVVHDYIQNGRRQRSLVAHYVRITQRVHRLFGRDVVYISARVAAIGRRVGLFPRSRVFIFPNSFYSFMRKLGPDPVVRGEDVVLCTGWGPNKDILGALALYRDSELKKSRRLKIFGLHGHREYVEPFLRRFPELADQLIVLPRLEDEEVGEVYRCAAWIWVHSLAEGYGRSIAEARLCGSRVVASNIAPFREQADESTFLYRGLAGFKSAVARCEVYPAIAPRRIPPEHDILRAEIRRFLGRE